MLADWARKNSDLRDSCACCAKGKGENSAIERTCCGWYTVQRTHIDQLESCQRLKLKAVKMEQESGNLGKHPIQAVPFKDGQSVYWNCCERITLCSKLVSLISVCPCHKNLL